MNKRELAYCAAYVQTHNVVESARLAGFGSPRSDAHRIHKRPHVQEMIARLLTKMEESIALDAAQVVNQFGAIALTRPDEFLKKDDDGLFQWKAPDELDERQRAAIQKIHVTNVLGPRDEHGIRHVTSQSYRYDFHDKMAALVHLGRHFDIFEESTPDRSGALNRFRNMSPEKLERLGNAMQTILEDEDGQVLSHA